MCVIAYYSLDSLTNNNLKYPIIQLSFTKFLNPRESFLVLLLAYDFYRIIFRETHVGSYVGLM